MLNWILAVPAAAAVAGAAWRARALSGSGAVAATGVGAVVLAFGGIGAAIILVIFFAASSALSALPGADTRSRRGARQVLANGSVAAAAIASHAIFPSADMAFLGALAAATADTWATEIGVRFGATPRSILTLRPRPRGASGAVSLVGTLGSVAGALALGAAGQLFLELPGCGWGAVALAGFIGALFDSLLGDGLQAVYRCPECGAQPETARHRDCPHRAERLSGVPGLDNDVVNWITTIVGAGSAVALQSLC